MAPKPWAELTEAGKFRRLRQLAFAALEEYHIVPERLRFVGGFTNAIFRVDSPSGVYALRIDYMQDHADASTAVELAWLAALSNETDLDIARVVPSRAGELFVHAGAAGVPGERRCVLFEWIPGKPLHDDLTPPRYHQLGEVAARLHLHGAQFEPPHRPMHWDRVFYWPEDVDPVVYQQPVNRRHFGGGRMKVLERAVEAVEPAFARLDPKRAQVIHADLHPWNVHVKGRRMIVLDFEDVAWGHRVQDIAITLFYERGNPEYPALRTAFKDGYETVAPWPSTYDGEVERFMAARTLMFINFVLNIPGDPEDFYSTAFPRLESFLRDWA